MKYQILYSWKNKKNVIDLSLAEFARVDVDTAPRLAPVSSDCFLGFFLLLLFLFFFLIILFNNPLK